MFELPVRQSGSAGSPVILFLHGSPLSGRMWQPQLDLLAEFHCIAPDLPGHGESAHLPVSMADIIEGLAALIRDASPSGKAHVVGLSFGGVVAQQLMVDWPEVVDHAILSGTATRMSRLVVWIAMLNEPVLRLLRPNQLAALLCLQFGIPTRYRDMMSGDFKVFSPRTLSEVMQTYLQIEMPTDTKSRTLIAVGEKETFYAKRAARLLSRSIPGARGVMVRGYGHVWNLEAPDLFAETVRAWTGDRELPDQLAQLGAV